MEKCFIVKRNKKKKDEDCLESLTVWASSHLEPSNQDGELSESQTSFSSSPTSYLLCLCEFVKDGAKSSKCENTEIGLVVSTMYLYYSG